MTTKRTFSLLSSARLLEKNLYSCGRYELDSYNDELEPKYKENEAIYSMNFYGKFYI